MRGGDGGVGAALPVFVSLANGYDRVGAAAAALAADPPARDVPNGVGRDRSRGARVALARLLVVRGR